MLRKQTIFNGIALLLLLLGNACEGSQNHPPTPTPNPPSVITPDSLPTLPAVPIDIPSPIQLLAPTPELPIGPQSIDPTNAGQMLALGCYGKGTILAHPSDEPGGMPVYSPDGLWMGIPTTAGIYVYDAVKMEELYRIPGGSTFSRSADGGLLASGGWGTVTLWNPVTGDRVSELAGDPEVYYRGPAFSPDGSLLSAAAWNGEIIVWSLESGKRLYMLPGDRLRFSPDGRLAVVITYGENVIHLYETSRGAEANQWNAQDAGFTPGGQLWLEEEDTVRLVYLDRNLVTAPFNGVQPSFSADGAQMALFANGQISLYDHQKGRRTQILEGSYLHLDGVLFSPDGRTLAGDVYTLRCPTCTEMDGWDRFLVLWQAADGSIIGRIPHPSGWIAYSVDGNPLIALDPETIRAIDTSDGSVVASIEGFTTPIEGLALSPDGKVLAAVHAAAAYILRLWDLETGRVELALRGREDLTLSNVDVSYSPDQKYIAVGGDLWDLASGERMTRVEQAIGEKTSCWPTSVAFSPDEDILTTGCFEGQLDRWLIPDGRLLQSMVGHDGAIYAQAYSPDGKYLAAIYGVPEDLVQVWKLPEGEPVVTLEGGHFTRVAYSPDGRTLATVLANPEYDQYGWPAGYVQLWDASDGVEFARLEIEDAVSIAFSPDSRILAAGSLDGTLRLWSMDGFGLLYEARQHYDRIQRLLFTPDGTSLISASLDGTMVRWGIPGQTKPDDPSTAGRWRTYTNGQFGFSIDYPPGWEILEVPNAEYATVIPQVWFSAAGFPPPQTGARADIVLQMLAEDPTPAWQPEQFEGYLAETIHIAGRDALRVTGINKESGYEETAMIIPWGEFYVLAMPNGTQESHAYFDRIMATLR